MAILFKNNFLIQKLHAYNFRDNINKRVIMIPRIRWFAPQNNMTNY